jgi:hypothetical protein
MWPPHRAADVRRQLAVDPEDGGALYLAAMTALSHQGVDASLAILARLGALGWDLDFPGSRPAPSTAPSPAPSRRVSRG